MYIHTVEMAVMTSYRSAERGKLKPIERESTIPTAISVTVTVTASIVLRKGRKSSRYRTVYLAPTRREWKQKSRDWAKGEWLRKRRVRQ